MRPTTVQAGTIFASINPDSEGAFRYMIGAPGMPSLYEVERTMVLLALKAMDGNKTHAARYLGISVRALRDKVKRIKIQGFEVGPYSPGGFYAEDD